MISRFFIDRPIFATVLSIAITLIGGIALFQLPVAQYPHITPPGISISISYPGASAQVVADTVGAPIEQQVNGVPGMLYMTSQSGNDGSYSLSVTFDIGTDVNAALVMVQNRVALAMPQLPTPVQNQGITIRKRTPDMLMIVNFFSPDGRYDDIYLSNFAAINIKDELLRVDGISDVFFIGERDYSIRAWLDPQKLAAHNMTATDVANAIRGQNVDAPIGRIGQPPSTREQSFQLTLDTLGRLDQAEQFGNIIIKTGGKPPIISPLGIPTAAASIGTARSASSMTSSMSSSSSTTDGTTTTGGSSTTLSSSGSTVASLTSGAAAGGGGTPGGGNAGGGGNTAGGGATGGGGSSGGSTNAGNSSATASMTSGIPAGGLASSDMTTADTTSGGVVGSTSLTGGVMGGGPPSPASAFVRLRDVARVEVGAQNYNLSCRFDGRPSVGIGLYQLPGTNALDVGDSVRAKMRELKRGFPDGVEYSIAYDTTPYVRDSIGEVLRTLFEAVIVVGLVVLFFLQDWRAMILPMIDVPVSLIGTFAVMAVLDFSLNNISLFGLVLTIGIVVDDAIVVLENIERQMAKGFAPREAAIEAMKEVTGPIIAVGLVLCAVFVPCAFLSGITGQFFRQFAVTITASTIISAINAITMTPSRAVLIFTAAQKQGKRGQSPFLRSTLRAVPGNGDGPLFPNKQFGHERKPEALPWWFFAAAGGGLLALKGSSTLVYLLSLLGNVGGMILSWQAVRFIIDAPWYAYFVVGAIAGGIFGWFTIMYINAVLGKVFRGFNRGFDALTNGYSWTVGKLLRTSVVVLFVYGGLLVLTFYVFDKAPTGFIPQQDQGRLIVSIQLPDSSSLGRTQAALTKIEEIAKKTPGVSHMVSIAGTSFMLQSNSPNLASMFIVLDSFDKRQRPGLGYLAIMDHLNKEWQRQVPEASVLVLGSSPIPGLGTAGGYKFMVEDRGGMGVRNLQARTEDLVRDLKKEPSIAKATTQFRANTPQLFLEIDRSKVASLGASLDDVNQTLDMFLGSLYVNSYNAFGRHWQVTVQAEDQYRDRVSDIPLFAVRNNQNQMVTLGTLTSPREIGGPISITRYNLYASAAVNGNVQAGYSSGDAVDAVETEAVRHLPLSMKADWTELMFLQTREARSGSSGLAVFGLAVICVFLALAALYESWSLPAAVILVVPLCLLCSAVGVLLTHREVNIFVQIGLVVLVALACKNAILIVEFGKQLTGEGKSAFEATQISSRMRLRPILMTSFAFIFGVLPLALATGAGAEMRRSLGIAVFYGMLGVTLFGIFLTPVFFYVIQSIGKAPMFLSERSKAAVSYVALGGLGGASGWLVARLAADRLRGLPNFGLLWVPLLGAALGVLLMWVLREFSRQKSRRGHRAEAGGASASSPVAANSKRGDRS